MRTFILAALTAASISFALSPAVASSRPAANPGGETSISNDAFVPTVDRILSVESLNAGLGQKSGQREDTRLSDNACGLSSMHPRGASAHTLALCSQAR